MPTYEYACSKCGATIEIYQSMKDSALEICPKDKCARKRWGKGRVHRQVGTGAGLIFKGSGFYTTDYRSENYKSAAKKDVQTTTPPAGTAPKSETASSKASDTSGTKPKAAAA